MFQNKILKIFIRNKYSKVLVNHFEKPQNVGSFDKTLKNIGTAIVGAPACGDVMKLQIKVNPLTNIIEDAKFKTYGCGSAIASSGQLIDMLRGKTIEEAQKISNQEIVDILELPAIKIHCSVLAEEAIHRAIDDFKSRRNND